MSIVKRSSYPGWNTYPIYWCSTTDDHNEVYNWMRRNGCDHYLLQSGGNGYTFQVRKNHEWFIMRWL